MQVILPSDKMLYYIVQSLEHDLAHDLHVGNPLGHDRGYSTLLSLPSETRDVMSGVQSGVQSGGITDKLTDDILNNITSDLAQQLIEFKNKQDIAYTELDESDTSENSKRIKEQLDASIQALQTNLKQKMYTYPEPYHTIQIVQQLEKNSPEAYNYFLKNGCDAELFDHITWLLNLYEMVTTLNPSNDQRQNRLFVSTQLVRSGLTGMFVFMILDFTQIDVANQIYRTALYLNNEIIEGKDIGVSIEKNPMDSRKESQLVVLTINSWLLEVTIQIKISPDGQVNLVLGNQVIPFVTPTPINLLQTGEMYNGINTNQEILCNYLTRYASIQENLYKQENMQVGGSIFGPDSEKHLLFQSYNTTSNLINEYINYITGGSRSRFSPAASIITKMKEQLTTNLRNNSLLTNDNYIINFAALLNPSEYPDISPSNFSVDSINKKSTFCNLLTTLNETIAQNQEQIPELINKLQILFTSATSQMLLPMDIDYESEQKMSKIIAALQFILISIENKDKLVRNESYKALENTENLKIFFNGVNQRLEQFKPVCEEFTRINESNKNLTGKQKLNFIYVVVMATSSVRYSINKLPLTSQLKDSGFIKSEYDMLGKMATLGQIQKMSPGTNIDDVSYKKLVQYITSGKSSFASGANIIGGNATDSNHFIPSIFKQSASTSLTALMTKFNNLTTTGIKYYINNANTSATKMGELNGQHFCPVSSIMDAQSTCSNVLSAVSNNGLEYGNFDVTIRDGNMARTGGETITYRIKYNVSKLNSKKIPTHIDLGAYVQVGSEVIINAGNIQGSGGSPLLSVPINGSDSPLKAVNCFKDLTIKVLQLSSRGSFEQLLQHINTDNSSIARQNRQDILNISFRKSLGDILQELNGVTFNGGYTKNTHTTDPVNIITNPNNARLTLSNDKPSGSRLLLLTLYGMGNINPNCMGGFMNGNGLYQLAYRYDGKMYGGKSQGKHKNRNTKKNKSTRMNKRLKNTKQKKTKVKTKQQKTKQKKTKQAKQKKTKQRKII